MNRYRERTCYGVSRALLAAALLGVCLGGCTLQRVADDTVTLDWLRLNGVAYAQADSRWQLPRDASIHVVESAPAEDPSWLAAAQAGVRQVFPAPVGVYPDYQLLVTWPEGDQARGAFALQVALVRSVDGALVEAASLDVRPHWFASRESTTRLVSQAFETFAGDFRATY